MACPSKAGMKKNSTKYHNLKILAVSDLVDKSLTKMVEDNSLEHVDLIISCGDLTPEYLSFLKNKLEKPLFYVKGNHDIRYTHSNLLGCENIHAKLVRFKTLNILGLEGSIWYSGGVNQYTDRQMNKIISRMWFSIWKKGGVNIVVTHAPPRDIHDGPDHCHTGFDSFVKLIDKRKPDYFIHGHIHKEFNSFEERTTMVNSTKVINTCGFTIFKI
ncbi:MAG: Icc-like protein [Desulfobacula sp.]|nr:Icc-like protein [Desulfobacula sp.]